MRLGRLWGIDGDDIAVPFGDRRAGRASINSSGGTDGRDISVFFDASYDAR